MERCFRERKNLSLSAKYNITAMFYDILDYPWERIYREWRPWFLGDLRGKALEQFSRVQKPGGKFRLLEMIYSKNKNI